MIRLETRPANLEGKGQVEIRDLVKNALRMRPDRIVVGEVRGGEALDMLQAMNTGHEGSLTTLHANSPRDALARLETMVLMSGMDLPVRAIREQIASALDLVVQISRLRDGSRRVTAIDEVIGMEGDMITLGDLFAFDYDAGFTPDGIHLHRRDPIKVQRHPRITRFMHLRQLRRRSLRGLSLLFDLHGAAPFGNTEGCHGLSAIASLTKRSSVPLRRGWLFKPDDPR